MKGRRLTLAVTAVAALTAGAIWAHRLAEARDAPAYRQAAVERGPLEVIVSATGNLAAMRTVQVGTQVSGQVAQIEADFNQRVKKGQLLARIRRSPGRRWRTRRPVSTGPRRSYWPRSATTSATSGS